MKLIVGLGNPGKKYEQTRHNVGFNVIDYIAKVYAINVTKLKCRALIGEGSIQGEKVIIAKPQTFMNLSGESVREICSYYKIETEDIVVVYDDKDIDVGKIRIRPKGSAGGHNGMKSIIYQLQTDEFARVRIGIGAPKNDMIDFVLGDFSKEEKKLVVGAAENAKLAVETIVTSDVSAAMNKYNGA